MAGSRVTQVCDLTQLQALKESGSSETSDGVDCWQSPQGPVQIRSRFARAEAVAVRLVVAGG